MKLQSEFSPEFLKTIFARLPPRPLQVPPCVITSEAAVTSRRAEVFAVKP